MSARRGPRFLRLQRPGLLWVGAIAGAQIFASWLDLGPPLQPLLPITFALTVPGFALLDLDLPVNKTTRIVLAVAASASTNVILASIILLPQPTWLVPVAVVAMVGVWRQVQQRRLVSELTYVRLPGADLPVRSFGPPKALPEDESNDGDPAPEAARSSAAEDLKTTPSDYVAAMLELLFRLPSPGGDDKFDWIDQPAEDEPPHPPDVPTWSSADAGGFAERVGWLRHAARSESNMGGVTGAAHTPARRDDEEPDPSSPEDGPHQPPEQIEVPQGEDEFPNTHRNAQSPSPFLLPGEPDAGLAPTKDQPYRWQKYYESEPEPSQAFGDRNRPKCVSRPGPLDKILGSDPIWRERASARSALVAGGEPATEETIDLNSAGLKELTTLPGVGLRLAAALINNRSLHGPFSQLSDLLEVTGFVPARIDRLEGKVRFEDS